MDVAGDRLYGRELPRPRRTELMHPTGWIDADFNVGWERKGYLHADALPLTGPNPEAVSAVASALGGGQIQAEISARTDVLTAMLFRSAQPLPDHLPHQAGFGFANPETTKRFVTSLSSLDLVRLTTAAPDQVPEAVARELARIPAFISDETLNLMDVAIRSALIFGVDVATGDFLLMSDTIRRLEPSARVLADRSSVPPGHRPTVTAMFAGEERVTMRTRG